MAKNDLIRRRGSERREYIKTGERLAQQLMTDVAVLILNEEFGFGYDRCKKFIDLLETQYDFYRYALEGGNESDVRQEHLDRQLKRIAGNHEFYPFEKRYPEIRTITYNKKGSGSR